MDILKLKRIISLIQHNYLTVKGQSLINHRKNILPPTADESTIFNHGNNDSIINFKGIKTAIVICYELEFPELI